ncbi:MAG: MDR family MFS transporter [Candidatus Saccharimonadales bacterium]
MSLHHITHREKVIVMAAVMSSLFLVALDQTIIATALGRIVEEFNSFSSLTWVVTAYMLTTTVTVPLAGKMSDIFGRRKILLSGVAVFILGSLFSGSSATIEQLIFARAFQGIGGGIIMANAFTVIGDLFSPRERGKWQGLIGAVFGLSSVVGPLLGGYLTDPHAVLGLTTNWRWTFWINVPIGIISFIIVMRHMPHIKHDHKPKIDYMGAAFLAVALSSLIFAVDNTEKVFAGIIENGISVTVLKTIFYIVALVSAALFIWAEQRAEEPIIPLKFFRNRTFSTMMIVSLLFGAAFLGAILYLTQFNQQVFGADATQSGLMLLPMIVGLAGTATSMGQFVSRTGKYKVPLIGGFTVATIAIFSLSFLSPDSPYWVEAIMMFFAGAGMGAGMPIINLAVQNEFAQKDLGAATSSAQLFRGLGSTIGTAILGTILVSGITSQLGDLSQNSYIKTLSAQPSSSQLLQKIDADTALNLNTPDFKETINKGIEKATKTLPETMRNKAINNVKTQQAEFSDKVVTAFSDSLRNVFYISSTLMLLATITAFGIIEKPLRGGHDDTPGIA